MEGSATGVWEMGYDMLEAESLGEIWSLKKLGKQAIGKSRGGWNTKLHAVSTADNIIVGMRPSGRECHDGPEGRISITAVDREFGGTPLLIDTAYESDEHERWQLQMVMSPLFHQKIAKSLGNMTRKNIRDVMFLSFILFAFIAIWLN